MDEDDLPMTGKSEVSDGDEQPLLLVLIGDFVQGLLFLFGLFFGASSEVEDSLWN